MGEFDKTISIYENLMSVTTDPQELAECYTNLLAAYTEQGQAFVQAPNASAIEESYEVVYNRACAYIQAQEWTRALEALEHSETLCRDLFTQEGWSDPSIDKELAIIWLQQAFVLQASKSNNAEALVRYQKVLNVTSPADASVLTIASNNLVALREAQENLFDSQKRFRAHVTDAVLLTKCSKRQREVLAVNRVALLCALGKTLEAKASLKWVQENVCPASNRIQALVVTLLLQEHEGGQHTQALAYLNQSGTSDSPTTVQKSLTLLRAQVWMQAQDLDRSAQELIQGPLCYEPAVMAMALSWLTSPESRESFVRRTLEHYAAQDPVCEKALVIQLGIAQLHLEQHHYVQATNAFEQLLDGPVASSLSSDQRCAALASYVLAL